MFLKDGYENVSVDDIIAATGTSKGTFYHYFSSKEEIIGEIPGPKSPSSRYGERKTEIMRSLCKGISTGFS
ncbi:helix-turn-helix domain containing protein [Paenibacillus larvae]|nr:helix-turn-helix domain-containing protein [Paenibacillus larvae]MDT2277077.1 helix-turn-helix domain containing protein [Paenibacillus larvae]